MADRPGSLLRLARSTGGNVLAITAAALPFILLLIGGGIDVSRGYMTRSSLQSACDAGVLAGRRAMSKSGTYGSAERAKAQKMFDFNLKAEITGNTGTTFTTVSHTDGSVSGQASTSLPLSVMQVIGADDFNLSVTCSAELQMASADVMFVLDTTGSMGWCPDGTECYSGPNSRIAGMREAVRDFYRTVAAAVVDKNETRIRFGFVPYTMAVNATELLSTGALPTSYIASSTNYQTKLAYYNTPVYVGTDGAPVVTTETYGSAISQTNCNNYGVNTYPTSGSNPTTSGTAPADKYTTTYSYQSWTKTGTSGSTNIGTCKRNKSVVTTTYATWYRFTNYRYASAAVNTSAFRNRGAVSMVTAIAGTSLSPTQGYFDMTTLAGMTGVTGLTTASSTWSGCLEERATVHDLAMDPVPAGALDLDINSAPTGAASSWKAYWPAMVYDRGTSYPVRRDTTSVIASTLDYCPAGRMKTFATVDLADPTTVPSWLETYLNTLTANGGTYHDIGMIWGARLASPHGIMASNVNAGSSHSISRHIIFLTDGEMAPETNYYSSYGLEWYDNRVAPSGTSRTGLIPYHNARFIAACNAAKLEDYTVWVIGFGTAVTDQMRACASAGRAYSSGNTTELRNTFRFIAGEVADLRLKQ